MIECGRIRWGVERDWNREGTDHDLACGGVRSRQGFLAGNIWDGGTGYLFVYHTMAWDEFKISN